MKEAEPEIKKETIPETSPGEFKSSDADITKTPGHMPTEEKNPNEADQKSTTSEATEPNDESAIASAILESTNLNDSSSTARIGDYPESSRVGSNDQEGVERGASGGTDSTGFQAGDEAKDHTTGDSEPGPAKRQKTDSEEASEGGDAVESINEDWQDVGAESSVLGNGGKGEESFVVGGGAEEDGKIEGEKIAFVLPVLSENKDTYEDVQRRVAEARERRAAAGAGQADTTNRLGKDW